MDVGDSKFLFNVGSYLQSCIAPHLRRKDLPRRSLNVALTSSSTTLPEPGEIRVNAISRSVLRKFGLAGATTNGQQSSILMTCQVSRYPMHDCTSRHPRIQWKWGIVIRIANLGRGYEWLYSEPTRFKLGHINSVSFENALIGPRKHPECFAEE